jgi:hypothetical protein
MYELFLWLMVNDDAVPHWVPISADGEDDGDDYGTMIARLREKIREACSASGIDFDLLQLRSTDGGMAVSAGFARNHPLGSGVEKHFLECIAKAAPATYGVIYWQDTDKDEPGGEFNVLKLANGEVTESLEWLVPLASHS